MLMVSGLAQALQAGASKLALELPIEGPLGGHVYRMGRNVVAQHDPITVRALYLEDKAMSIMLVSVDVHSITPELRQRVLAFLPEEVSASHLILTATHTHNGPGGLSKNWFSRRYMGGYNPTMLELIAEGVAQVMGEAVESKTRGTIGYKVSSKMVLNKNRFVKGGGRDEELGVIRVDDSDGNPIAILGSLSAHPSTIGREQSLVYSAGYPGYFCNKLESLSHENTVAFFLSGAVGDQACNNQKELRGWEWTKYIGEELAVQVKSIANKIDCQEYPVSLHAALVPVPTTTAMPFVSSEVLFQTLEINDLLVSFVPGEPYAGVKKELKRRAKQRGYSEYIMVGLSNDYVMDIAETGEWVSREDEPGLNILGHEGAAWCSDAVSALMQRGESVAVSVQSKKEVLTKTHDFYILDISGDASTRAWHRGSAISVELELLWDQSILQGLQDKRINVTMPLWNSASSLVNTAPIALPLLADAQRNGISALSTGAQSNLFAMASGAQFPSDALWLLQQQAQLIEDSPVEAKVFAVTGKRCSADGPLLGYVAMMSRQSLVSVTREYPEKGRNYLHVGPLSGLGLRVGMNDAGIAMALLPESGNASSSAIQFELSRVLAGASDLSSAVGATKELSATDSTAMLILDRPVEDARYLDFKGYWRDKTPKEDSFLPNDAPETVSREDLQGMLYATGQQWLEEQLGRELVVYVVILSPVSRTAYVAVYDVVNDGISSEPTEFQAFTIERGKS